MELGVLNGIFKKMGIQAPQQGALSSQPTAISDTVFNEELADFVNKEYIKRQTDRRSWELQWRLNAEFLNGNQYLDINPVSLTLEEVPKLFWWTEKEVFNQISTIVETRISKLSRQKPMMKCRPASSDDVDISAAKITSMLMSSTWNDQTMDELYEELVSWLELTGTVFVKTTWSKNRGRVIYRGPGQQQPQAEGAESENDNAISQDQTAEQQTFGGGQMQEIREGDIDTIIVPSHEIFPDSVWRSSMREVRSMIHARAFHVDEIEETWGQKVEPEKVDVLTMQRQSSSMGGMGYQTGSMRTNVMQLENHAVVKEFYEKPSKNYPEGRYIVVASRKTLYAGTMPYQLGNDGEREFPFIRTVSIDHPGCIFGKTVLERCIPVQRRYNAWRNRKAEYLNMVAIGQWYEPIGTLDEGIELSNAPGNIIRYRASMNGVKPEPVSFPNLPASFENEGQILMSEFTSISGVSELSRFAEAPDGVKSGVALGIAKEQDDTRVSTSVQRISNTIVKLGKNWIRLYRQFVEEPRLLRYVGANREVDVREWSMSDLRSDDVFIENLAALVESPAQRRQMIFDLLGAGLFNRPELSNLSEEGRQKVFQLLQFGHWETGAEDDHYLQRSRARRENRDMMQGQPSPVMDFDDHQLHIEQHNRMRMQAEYDELLRGSPAGQMVNDLMMQHIAEHIQLALKAMPQEPVQEPGKPGEKKADPKKE